MPAVTVVCPQCRSFLQLDNAVPVGRPVRCRICSATFTSGGNSAREPDPPPTEKRPVPVKEKRRPRKQAADPLGEDRAWLRQQQQQRKRLLMQSLVLVGGLVLLIGGIIVLASSSDSGPDRKAKKGATGSTKPPDEKRPLRPLGWPPARPEEEEPARKPARRMEEEEDPLRAPPLRFPPRKEEPPPRPRRMEEEDPLREPPLRRPPEEEKLPGGERAGWTTRPALLARLDAEVNIRGYRLRPPKGYRFQEVPGAPEGAHFVAWVGPRRADFSAPQLMLGILNPPPDQPALTLDQTLDKLLAGVRQRRANWTQTELERGKINGLTFVRRRWSGRGQGREMRGFLYVARDGHTIIQLSSQDIIPHDAESLELADGAALTFKKP